MRKSLFLAAAVPLLVAGSAFAGPTAGDLGLGTSYVEKTPVGIRYWMTPTFGIDAEIGFDSYDVTTGSGDLSSQFRGQIAFPYNVWECSDVWFHLRPFAIFDLMSYEDWDVAGTMYSVDSRTNIHVGLALEMEAWLLECLSFSVWHGVAAVIRDEYTDPVTGNVIQDSTTDFGTEGMSLGNAGFHLYF